MYLYDSKWKKESPQSGKNLQTVRCYFSGSRLFFASVRAKHALNTVLPSTAQNECWPSACITEHQGGLTCGAIDEPRKSSKVIDERVIINFRDENVVISRFRDKNIVIARFRDKNVVIAPFRDKNVVIGISVLSIAFLFYKYGKYI